MQCSKHGCMNKTTIQAEFTQAELVMLVLGVIARKGRALLAYHDLEPTQKDYKATKRMLDIELKRLEALHQKLTTLQNQLDKKELDIINESSNQ